MNINPLNKIEERECYNSINTRSNCPCWTVRTTTLKGKINKVIVECVELKEAQKKFKLTESCNNRERVELVFTPTFNDKEFLDTLVVDYKEYNEPKLNESKQLKLNRRLKNKLYEGVIKRKPLKENYKVEELTNKLYNFFNPTGEDTLVPKKTLITSYKHSLRDSIETMKLIKYIEEEIDNNKELEQDGNKLIKELRDILNTKEVDTTITKDMVKDFIELDVIFDSYGGTYDEYYLNSLTIEDIVDVFYSDVIKGNYNKEDFIKGLEIIKSDIEEDKSLRKRDYYMEKVNKLLTKLNSIKENKSTKTLNGFEYDKKGLDKLYEDERIVKVLSSALNKELDYHTNFKVLTYKGNEYDKAQIEYYILNDLLDMLSAKNGIAIIKYNDGNIGLVGVENDLRYSTFIKILEVEPKPLEERVLNRDKVGSDVYKIEGFTNNNWTLLGVEKTLEKAIDKAKRLFNKLVNRKNKYEDIQIWRDFDFIWGKNEDTNLVTESKVKKDLVSKELASKLVDFMQDYDPYEFNDVASSSNNAIETEYNNLQDISYVKSVIDFLQDMIKDTHYEMFNIEQIRESKKLLSELKKSLRNNKTLKESPDEFGLETNDELDELEKQELEKVRKAFLDRKNKVNKERDTKQKEKELNNKELGQQALKDLGNDLSYDTLFDKLVPDYGKADTLLGEILRAFNHIEYRWYNDGDKFYEPLRVGSDNCPRAAIFLHDLVIGNEQPFEEIIEEISLDDEETKRYEEWLETLKYEIERFIKLKLNKYAYELLVKPNEIEYYDVIPNYTQLVSWFRDNNLTKLFDFEYWTHIEDLVDYSFDIEDEDFLDTIRYDFEYFLKDNQIEYTNYDFTWDFVSVDNVDSYGYNTLYKEFDNWLQKELQWYEEHPLNESFDEDSMEIYSFDYSLPYELSSREMDNIQDEIEEYLEDNNINYSEVLVELGYDDNTEISVLDLSKKDFDFLEKHFKL